jgi:hypothetical protein
VLLLIIINVIIDDYCEVLLNISPECNNIKHYLWILLLKIIIEYYQWLLFLLLLNIIEGFLIIINIIMLFYHCDHISY